MSVPLLDTEGTGAEVAGRLLDYGDRRVRVLVLPVAEETMEQKDTRPIADVLAEIAAGIREDQLAHLPPDFTDQLDHYIYGAPKQ